VRALILEHYPSNKTSGCQCISENALQAEMLMTVPQLGRFPTHAFMMLASDLKTHVEHTHILTCAQLPDAVLVRSPQHELGLLAPLSQE